jgi:hypothetical protein
MRRPVRQARGNSAMDGIVTIALAGLVESEVPASPFWMSEKVSRPSAHQQAEASGKRRPGSVEQGEPRKTANTRSIDQREGLVFPVCSTPHH